MNKSQLKGLKDKIKEEMRITQDKISKYSELCKPISPENSIGRITRMDAINNKSVVESALRKSKEKMSQLKAMQNNISNSDFGNCKKCQKEIPFGRLMLQPHSKFCVICAD